MAPFSLEILIENIEMRTREIFLASETVGTEQPVHSSPQERFGITARAHVYREIRMRNSQRKVTRLGVGMGALSWEPLARSSARTDKDIKRSF